MNTDDRKLIERLRAGDKAAFDTIYYKYVGQLMAFCQSFLKVLEDSEEVVEDVFISLWNNRSNLKNLESLRPLLFISTRNRLLSVLRKRVNSNIYEDYVTAANEHSDNESPMEYDEFERMVMKCIDSLPATQKKVVMMSRFDNMSNQEIADALNLSMQTVKNALSQGLKSLLKKINACQGLIITIISIASLHIGS